MAQWKRLFRPWPLIITPSAQSDASMAMPLVMEIWPLVTEIVHPESAGAKFMVPPLWAWAMA